MKDYLVWLPIAGALLALASYAWRFRPRKPKLAPAHEVIDAVKDELRFFDAYMRAHLITMPASSSGGTSTVRAVPKSAKLTLKTVSGSEDDPTAGLKSPIGVIALDPAFSGAYSVSNAQAVTFDFDLTKSPAAALAVTDTDAARKAHPITLAVHDALRELTLVDHEKLPRLAGPDLTVTVNFDVVDKTTVGATVTLSMVKLGNKRVITDEAHQTLEFRLGVEGASFFLPS